MLEANEQIRGEAGQFPEDEQREDVVTQDDAKHRAHEGEERRIEAPDLRMVFEVAAGVENDECADAGNEDGEEQPETVEVEGQRQAERRRPRRLDQAPASRHRAPHLTGKDEREERGQHRKKGGVTRTVAYEPGREQCDDERRQNETDHSADAIVVLLFLPRTSPLSSPFDVAAERLTEPSGREGDRRKRPRGGRFDKDSSAVAACHGNGAA